MKIKQGNSLGWYCCRQFRCFTKTWYWKFYSQFYLSNNNEESEQNTESNTEKHEAFQKNWSQKKGKCGLMEWKKMGNERKSVNKGAPHKITKIYLSFHLSPLRKNKYCIKKWRFFKYIRNKPLPQVFLVIIAFYKLLTLLKLVDCWK